MQKLPIVDRACCAPEQAAPEPTERHSDDGDAAALIEWAGLFRALADPTRLAILRQLRAREEVCACDFVACCEVAQPTVSHHLKVLREAGLVVAQRRGTWLYYRLNPAVIERMRRLVP